MYLTNPLLLDSWVIPNLFSSYSNAIINIYCMYNFSYLYFLICFSNFLEISYFYYVRKNIIVLLSSMVNSYFHKWQEVSILLI